MTQKGLYPMTNLSMLADKLQAFHHPTENSSRDSKPNWCSIQQMANNNIILTINYKLFHATDMSAVVIENIKLLTLSGLNLCFILSDAS